MDTLYFQGFICGFQHSRKHSRKDTLVPIFRGLYFQGSIFRGLYFQGSILGHSRKDTLGCKLAPGKNKMLLEMLQEWTLWECSWNAPGIAPGMLLECSWNAPDTIGVLKSQILLGFMQSQILMLAALFLQEQFLEIPQNSQSIPSVKTGKNVRRIQQV